MNWNHKFYFFPFFSENETVTEANGENIFYYNRDPCGGIPTPTNTILNWADVNLENLDRIDRNDPTNRSKFFKKKKYLCTKFFLKFFIDFLFACNVITDFDKPLTTTMDNYIVMPPMPTLR